MTVFNYSHYKRVCSARNRGKDVITGGKIQEYFKSIPDVTIVAEYLDSAFVSFMSKRTWIRSHSGLVFFDPIIKEELK